MELVVQGFGKEYVIEVGEDDTIATMRQKVASAAGLREDSFRMGFGGKDEGEDITQLSAGDIVVLTKVPPPAPRKGDRVKIVNTEQRCADTNFEGFRHMTFVDEVTLGSFARLLAVTQHPKDKEMQVFIVQFDEGRRQGAIMLRDGIENAFPVGREVIISNAGCRYFADDCRSVFPDNTIVDECDEGDTGVILRVKHFERASLPVYLVAVDRHLDCVVMGDKGLSQREVEEPKEHTTSEDEN